MELSPVAKHFCAFVLPWGKYGYQKLPMRVCNSFDTFQENISEIFDGFEMVHAYIDDVIVSKYNF